MLQRTVSLEKAPLAGRFPFVESAIRVLGLAALFFSWLAPNHYPPWTSFHGEAAAFAAVCLLALARVRAPGAPRRDPVSTAAFLIVAVIAAQWIAGLIPYGGDAFLSAVYVVGAAIAFRVGHSSERDQGIEPLTWMAGAVAAAACLSVLIGVLQWQHLEQSWGIFATDRDPAMRVYGNLGQPNHLATLCVMGVVLTLWLRYRRTLSQWQFMLLVTWLSLGLTLTESRSGLLGAVAVGILLILSHRLLPGAVRFVMAWWAGLALGYLLLPRLNAGLLLAPARIRNLGQDNDRLVMWRQAIAAIEDAPWFGHGWRQTMFALKKAAVEVPGRLATDYAHNIVLDVLVWVGVPLGLLLLSAVTIWLARRWWGIRDARQLLLFAAAVPVLVHSQFEFPFAYAYFLFPTAWLLGALDAAQRGQRIVTIPATRPAVAAVWLMVVAYAGICLAIASEYLEVEEDYRVMRFELRRVGQVPVGYEPPKLRFLTQWDDLLEVGRIGPKPGMPPQLMERMRVASERNGWATLDLNYVVALGFHGQAEEASRRLLQLEHVYGSGSAKQAYAMFRAFRTTNPGLEGVRVP